MAKHGHDFEVIVSQTTPQGMQQEGLEVGHDQRDIFVGTIMKWLVSTAIGTGLIITFLVGLYRFMDNHYAYLGTLPTPMYVQHKKPPEPRIEGFMSADDYGPLHTFPVGKQIPRDGTPEELQVVRQSEEQKLKSFGLEAPANGYNDKYDSDMLRRPLKISDEQVAMVAKEGPPAPAGKNAQANEDARFADGGPSDASGGLVNNPSR